MIRPPPRSTLFPCTTLFRSEMTHHRRVGGLVLGLELAALPRSHAALDLRRVVAPAPYERRGGAVGSTRGVDGGASPALVRSEEHTSELQSHLNLVCRLLL